ncbi:hypothetical protein [Nitrospirillum amazonense]|uniref:hypothetical protein n=1 Tax=Nitrospirillum amazonense TaxID=28077 RepID=UPI0024124938|nr:hypothetical protein [Nitrospirillum amazonense]
MTRFKNPMHQTAYDRLTAFPPPPADDGAPRGGRAFWEEYRLGFLKPAVKPARIGQGTPGYAAWAAGRDAARRNAKATGVCADS